MSGTGTRFVLPSDVILTPYSDLPQESREELSREADAVIVTRRGNRGRPLIVGPDLAALLECFAVPRTVPDALVQLARSAEADAEALLERSHEALQALNRAGILVEEGAEAGQTLDSRWNRGDVVAGLEVLRPLSVSMDLETYQCRRPGGTICALKIARSAVAHWTNARLEREVDVLSSLALSCVPRAINHGRHGQDHYLVTEWRTGSPPVWLADRSRKLPIGRDRIWRLVDRLLTEFESLHQAGVVHADIHQGNVLATGSLDVSILDFDYAVRLGVGPDSTPRTGTGLYTDPETARARLEGSAIAPASIDTDLYALAALSYRIVTGQHRLKWSLYLRDMLRRIAEDEPRTFAEVDFEWPAAESVLAVALSPRRDERFASAESFREAWADARPAKLPAPMRTQVDSEIPGLLRTVALEDPAEAVGAQPDADGLCIEHGAAGVAFSLLRAGELLGRPDLLIASRRWARRASECWGPEHDAEVVRVDTELTRVHPASLLRGLGGIYMMDALSAAATSRHEEANVAVRQLAELAPANPADELDLYGGWAGYLVACAAVVEAMRDQPCDAQVALVASGDQTFETLVDACQSETWLDRGSRAMQWGMAHGWAGLLYAVLRWARTRGRDVPSAVMERLEYVSDRAEPEGSGVQWRYRLSDSGGWGDIGATWCNGTAGLAVLWATATHVLGGSRFDAILERTAWHVWEHRISLPIVCCGAVGQAYSLLSTAQVTGDPAWVERARALHPPLGSESGCTTGLGPSSLWKGDLGRELLQIELTTPHRADFPLVGSGGRGPGAADLQR